MNDDYSDLLEDLPVKPKWLNSALTKGPANKKSGPKATKNKPNFSYVIRGKYRRRRIPAPITEDGHFEITPQKIKESVFQVIENIFFNWRESLFIDCFAGSGQMAIEALSLECGEVILFEKSKLQVKQLKDFFFKQKLESAAIYNSDFFQLLARYVRDGREIHPAMEKMNNAKQCILYFDPPYEMLLAKTKLIADFLNQLMHIQSGKQNEILLLVQAPSMKSNFFKGPTTKKKRQDFETFCLLFDKVYPHGKNQVLLKKIASATTV